MDYVFAFIQYHFPPEEGIVISVSKYMVDYKEHVSAILLVV